MKQFKYYLMAAFVAAATCTGFSSCSDNDDEESTVNPVSYTHLDVYKRQPVYSIS